MTAHPCPICKTPVVERTRAWPFCGERCRLIDLGNWLGGTYAIPGEPAENDGSADRDSADESAPRPSRRR